MRLRNWLLVGVPWLLIGVVFLATFQGVGRLRSATFDSYPGPGDNLWRMNATFAISAARHWKNDGLLASSLMIHFHNTSVEEPADDAPYFSYPPLFALVPLAISAANGRQAEIQDATGAGAACQLLAALFAALFVYLLASRLGAAPPAAALLAAAAGWPALVITGGVLFFPGAWWADVVVLPLLALLLALELAPDEWRARGWYRGLFAITVVLGTLADWLFHLALLAVFVRRLTARPRRVKPWLLAAPAAFVLFLAAQVTYAGRWAAFFGKILDRTGVSLDVDSAAVGPRGWLTTLRLMLGPAGTALYWGALALLPVCVVLFLARHRLPAGARLWVEAAFLALVPVELHSFLLHGHYYLHAYNVLKFALVLPALWFGVLPALLVARARSPWMQLALASVVACLAAGFGSGYTDARSYLGSAVNLDADVQRYCHEVNQRARPEEVLVSPDFATRDELRLWRPPRRASVTGWAKAACRKEVYLAYAPSDLPEMYIRRRVFRRLIGKEFRIRLWTIGAPPPEWQAYLVAGSREDHGDLEAYELSPSVVAGP